MFEKHQTISVQGELAKKILNGVKVNLVEFESQTKQKIENEFLIKFEDRLVGLYHVENGRVEPLVFLY